MKIRDADGFSLIESMVALAVLSLAVMALLNLVGENSRAANSAELKFFATIVAENVLVETVARKDAASYGRQEGNASSGGRSWAWTRTIEPGPVSGLYRVSVSVRHEGSRQVLADISAIGGLP